MDLTQHFQELEARVSQADTVSSLLAEDFREFGKSGRVYDREETLAALASTSLAPVMMEDFQAALLSDTVALVTYRAKRDGVESLRSSIWVKRDERWQIVFHQGTLTVT